MCLFTETNKPEIADTDIKVFKCFRSIKERYSSKPYRDLRTLYLEHDVSRDEASGKIPFRGRNHREPDLLEGKYRVGPGYIHAFLDFETAKEVTRKHFIGKDWYHPVIVEAVIPKGTPYFRGVDSHDVPCIAAEAMIIGKQLECYVEREFHECESYYAALDKANKSKSQKETQPFE